MVIVMLIHLFYLLVLLYICICIWEKGEDFWKSLTQFFICITSLYIYCGNFYLLLYIEVKLPTVGY